MARLGCLERSVLSTEGMSRYTQGPVSRDIAELSAASEFRRSNLLFRDFRFAPRLPTPAGQLWLKILLPCQAGNFFHHQQRNLFVRLSVIDPVVP